MSFSPVVSAGPEGVHFFLRKGGTLRLGSGPSPCLKGSQPSGEAAKLKDISIAEW